MANSGDNSGNDSNNAAAPKGTKKKPKAKGPIRIEAIVPVAIIFGLIYGYFFLFFDSHVKSLIEWGGYKALGAEVNVASLKTSFFDASLRISGIEITDADKPQRNLFEIGEIRFKALWDALLRAKFVVEEAVVEKIKYGTTRKRVGKVKSPEPPATGPSFIDEETKKLRGQALTFVTAKYDNNVVSDLAKIIGGANYKDQLQGMIDSLPSKKRAQELESNYKGLDKVWDQKFKALPQQKDFEELNQRFTKVKSKDFNSPQELAASLQEYDKIYKELDAKVKLIQTTKDELSSDLAKVQSDVKGFEEMVKTDTQSIEKRFQIPKLDAKEITLSLFDKYLAPYKEKVNKYKDMLFKYLPPKFTASKEVKAQIAAEEEAKQVVPHQRANGISYEFGAPRGYPLFWIKRTGISSQAGADPQSGNISGEIRDITSNQKMTGRPTTAKIEGDFPGINIRGLLVQASINNAKPISEVLISGGVESFPIESKVLVDSPDVNIAFINAVGKIKVSSKIVGLKQYDLNLSTVFSNAKYDVGAKEKIADDILKRVFSGLPAITLNASAAGDFPSLPLRVESNLGPEIERGFRSAVQAKIDEARSNIEKAINAEIGKVRAQLEKQVNDIKNKLDSEVKKAQQSVESQKAQLQSRIDQAKKDTENKAKSQVEDEAKKKMEELKKKLKF